MNESPAELRRRALPVLILAVFAVSGLVNAGDLIHRRPPTVIAVVMSAVYVVVWLVHAFDAGRRRSSGSLRRMAVIWAVVIGVVVIFGDYVRLGLDGGSGEPGGWVVSALLLVVCAPLYGLVAVAVADPLVVLIGVSVGCAVLTLITALLGRLMSPPSPSGARPRPVIPERGIAEDGSVVRGLRRW